jgi:hypothetical protein
MHIDWRPESGDACERHPRAIRAYQWHLDGVIAAIPLLLQLSILLFLAGLVICVLSDSKSIGVTVLALITQTIVLYVVAVILSLDKAHIIPRSRS